MLSFVSSRVSKQNVLLTLYTLGITTFSLPVMAATHKTCVKTTAGDVVCGELVAEPSANANGKHIFEGTWEFQNESNNRWQMKATWNEQSNRYEGILTRQGVLSQSAGFSINELVWTATPIPNSSLMRIQQKYRQGSNGVSTHAEWGPKTLDLDKSTPDSLVYTDGPAAVRVQ